MGIQPGTSGPRLARTIARRLHELMQLAWRTRLHSRRADVHFNGYV
jgi:hypothetical protein